MNDITENDLDEDDAGQQPRVTDAPMEIWLQYGDELLVDTPHSALARDGEVSWCDSPVFPFDVKYVRADEIDRLRARVAELEAQERGGWVRTSGWSNELYSFDRSDNEDGTFSLTVSERGGGRLVDIDRLTASDLERIVDVVGDGVVSRPAAELEAAKGEPGVWLRDQRGHYEGRETLDPMFYLGARNPGRGANGATYSPFYAAPPAPRVDVDAISDEALNAAWSYIIFNAENEQTEAVYDMRAALRAIFNKGE